MFKKNQERFILITNIAIYFSKGVEIKRKLKIEDIHGITFSKKSNQFVIHFNEFEYDYLLLSERRNQLILLLQNIYYNLKNKDLLFTIKIDRDLSKYVITLKERQKHPYLFKLDKNELVPKEQFFEIISGEANKGNSKSNDLSGIKNQNIKEIVQKIKNENNGIDVIFPEEDIKDTNNLLTIIFE